MLIIPQWPLTLDPFLHGLGEGSGQGRGRFGAFSGGDVRDWRNLGLNCRGSPWRRSTRSWRSVPWSSLTKDPPSVCAALLDSKAFAAGLSPRWGATALLRRLLCSKVRIRARGAQDHLDAKTMVPPRRNKRCRISRVHIRRHWGFLPAKSRAAGSGQIGRLPR